MHWIPYVGSHTEQSNTICLVYTCRGPCLFFSLLAYLFRNLCPFHDPKPVCLWPPSVSSQILANPKHCLPNDGNIWNHNFSPSSGVLASGVQSGLGSKGAALANSISYWINVLLLAL